MNDDDDKSKILAKRKKAREVQAQYRKDLDETKVCYMSVLLKSSTVERIEELQKQAKDAMKNKQKVTSRSRRPPPRYPTKGQIIDQIVSGWQGRSISSMASAEQSLVIDEIMFMVQLYGLPRSEDELKNILRIVLSKVKADDR